MAHYADNAKLARSVLREAIQSGVYPPGSTLPSTRSLAEQFGINRNTATKIYHELASDYLLRLSPNRPPMVRQNNDVSAMDRAFKEFRHAFEHLVQDARLLAMSNERIRRLVNDLMEEYLVANGRLPVYLAECNEDEAHWFAQELTLRLGQTVRPVLLNQLPEYDEALLVFTPYFHLREAREAAGSAQSRVVGLVVTADGSDIARVASMVNGGPLGVVAVHQDAAQRLHNLLSFQINVPMIMATTEAPETVDAMRDQVECVVCTPRAYAVVRPRLRGIPVTMVQYQIDHESLELARREVARVQAEMRDSE